MRQRRYKDTTIRYGVLLWLILSSTGCFGAGPHSVRQPERFHCPPKANVGFIRGVALGSRVQISNRKLNQHLRELVALGATHVSVVLSWSTPNVRSAKITRQRGATPHDALVLRIMARAKALGLRVLLFPLLDVRHRKPLEWRGTIKPNDWDMWWRSYRRFIVHYARLAAGRAALLSIGSELVTTEKMRPRWAKLIREVRTVYKGKLLYSANWDHYEPVAFWDLVDVIGLTGYHRVADESDASQSRMVELWLEHQRGMLSWAQRMGRPFLFTEVGYPSIDGGAVYPWDYTRRAPVDLEEQRRAYAAFVKTWTNVRQLQGVFFWDWNGKGGPRDRRFTPRGKPAEQVIRTWFQSWATCTPR